MNEYEIQINGISHTVQLTAEDAKARGLTVAHKAIKEPANKARQVKDK